MNLQLTLFTTFFKIGMFTIGGGLAMLPLIERDVVEKHKWIDKKELLDVITIAQSMPGIFAFNFAILIGHKIDQTRGSILCGLGTVIPSFLIILAIAISFSDFKDNAYVAKIFKGMRPAVVALLLVPLISTAKTSHLTIKTGLLAIAVTLLITFADINPVYIILAVALSSVLYGNIVYKKRHKNDKSC